MAQQKGDVLWLWTKTTEIEKGWSKGEDQGRFDCISLEGREVYILTNKDPPLAEGNFCGDSNPPVKPHNGTVQPAHGSRRQFWSYGQQLFYESTYLQVGHEIVFPPSGSNSTQQLDTVIFMWG